MQANFSALYHGCSLKTILDFCIINTKIIMLQNSLQSFHTSKALAGDCRQGPWFIQFIQLIKLSFTFTLRL